MKIRTKTILRLRDAMLESGRRPSVVVSPAYETLARAGMLSMEETAAVARVEPLAETMFLMMAADGKIADQERDALRGALRGLCDGLLRSGTINVMLENFERRLQEHGRDERLREIAEELSEHASEAESAFTLAAAAALADDEVADEEQAFINQLAEWLGISAARAGEILDQLEADRDSAE
ncbi:MAG: TerB family tellurite resistance protein [Polyangiaceae bacterium]